MTPTGKSDLTSLPARSIALALALWFGCLPAIMYTRPMQLSLTEMDMARSPLAEEEELEEPSTLGSCTWSFSEPLTKAAERSYRQADEQPIAASHQEVASPPPKRV